MVIAFCTSCMNRLWQLKRTLGPNLETLAGTPHFVALCNYNSTDGLREYVREHFLDACRGGSLIHFQTTVPNRFHASKAKNAAHRLALTRTPDILFNLDADNFITAETITVCVERFNVASDIMFHHWSGFWGDGSFGRIAVRASTWVRLGGYDETMREMSYQDTDLLNRGRAAGLRYERHCGGLRQAIQNSMLDKTKNVELPVADERNVATAAAHYARLSAENFAQALSRPILLPFEDQTRLAGTLNFATDTVV